LLSPGSRYFWCASALAPQILRCLEATPLVRVVCALCSMSSLLCNARVRRHACTPCLLPAHTCRRLCRGEGSDQEGPAAHHPERGGHTYRGGHRQGPHRQGALLIGAYWAIMPSTLALPHNLHLNDDLCGPPGAGEALPGGRGVPGPCQLWGEVGGSMGARCLMGAFAVGACCPAHLRPHCTLHLYTHLVA
jgi:hypothetical protein